MAKKTTAEELRSLAEKLNKIADSLCQDEKPEEAPKKEIPYVDVRKKLVEKSRAGFTDQIKEIIQKHGANKLSDLDPKEYEEVLQEVEALS